MLRLFCGELEQICIFQNIVGNSTVISCHYFPFFQKKVKKAVDKRGRRWYDIKAVPQRGGADLEN